MNDLKIYKIRDIDWTALSASQSFQCPLTVAVTVVDMDDREHSITQTVTVISLLEMREYLIKHFSWSWLDVELTPEPTAEQRFEHIWNTFVDMKSEQISRSVTAWMIKYNPCLTFFRDEFGDSDKIEYASKVLDITGNYSSSMSQAGGTTGVTSTTYSDGDNPLWIKFSPDGISTGTKPKTTVSVGTYDDDTGKYQSDTENEGQTASLASNQASGKSEHQGTDTHSRDMHFEGSDALHTSTQMVHEEIEMRMKEDIGLRLLDEFTREFLFGYAGGDEDECYC